LRQVNDLIKSLYLDQQSGNRDNKEKRGATFNINDHTQPGQMSERQLHVSDESNPTLDSQGVQTRNESLFSTGAGDSNISTTSQSGTDTASTETHGITADNNTSLKFDGQNSKLSALQDAVGGVSAQQNIGGKEQFSEDSMETDQDKWEPPQSINRQPEYSEAEKMNTQESNLAKDSDNNEPSDSTTEQISDNLILEERKPVFGYVETRKVLMSTELIEPESLDDNLLLYSEVLIKTGFLMVYLPYFTNE